MLHSNLTPLNELIREAATYLRHARRGVAFTGAGISTPSGIPDFRSTDSGLWARYDPMEVASLLSFRYHPERFFDWVRPLVRQMLAAEPNPAHHALARLEQAGHLQAVITQNIDGLHQKAGSRQVYEIHGTLETATCVRCYTKYPSSDYLEDFLATDAVPHCPRCGGVLKPDVVLFGEQLPWEVWRQAEQAARNCDLMLVAGSSLEVTPAANLPLVAAQNGAALIIVNNTPTYLDVRADVVIHADVAEVLPQIADQALKANHETGNL